MAVVEYIIPSIGYNNIPIYPILDYSESYSYGYNIDKYSFRHEIVKRSDSLSDINWGMTILANSIKVFSAILTILAVDDTDRLVIRNKIFSYTFQ